MYQKLKLCFVAALWAGFLSSFLTVDAAWAQAIDQEKGSDQKVDYEALKKFGPWDDRNYYLDAEDLELLAENEAEQRPPVPAFYRVELRKRYPDLPKTG